ncbi:MAG: DinB family protein [bacterium]|nr:DinB family protein [bacterium]
MIKELANASVVLLEQIADLVKQLDKNRYAKELPLLNGNTIGKHVRHVLEVYGEMVNGELVVNYDARKRSLSLETDVDFALHYVSTLKTQLRQLNEDALINLRTKFDINSDVLVHTSLGRELAYNIEHAIHHMAIIQIVVKHYHKDILLSDQFGVAFSTLAYLNENVYTHLPS